MEANSRFFDPSRLRGGSRRSGDFWHRVLPWAWASVCLVGFFLVGAFFWPVMERSNQLQRHKADLEVQIAAEDLRGRQLKEELLALQHDRDYVERMARDILQVGREGETIFKFQPYSATDVPRSVIR